MKSMNVKYLKIIEWLLLACLILEFPWTRIVKTPRIISNFASVYEKELILLIAVVAVMLINLKGRKQLGNFKYVNRYVMFVCLCTVLVMFLSFATYRDQSIRETYVRGHHLFMIILAPVFLYIFIQKGGYLKVMRWLLIYSYGWCAMVLFQEILYLTTGHQFFREINFEWVGFLDIRFLRISLLAIPNIMILYCISEILQKRKTIWNVGYCLLSSVCVLFIQQTRAYIIAIGLAIIIMVIVNSNNWLKTMRNVFTILIILVVLLQTNYVRNLIFSFSSTSDKIGSALARAYAYKYYWNCFLKNPIFANGFASSVLYPQIEHGHGAAFYSDCGVVGLIAQMGIWGIAIYVLYIGRMLYIVLDMIKRRILSKYLLVIGLLSYTIATSISLAYTSPALSMVFPLCFAWTEYLNYMSVKEG